MQSDDRLAHLFRRGVEPAFDELVRRHRGSLVAFAGGIAGSGRAEDVVQDSLVKAHRVMAEDEVREPKAWLYKVVRNTALNEVRDGRKHDHAELGETEAPFGVPETEVERREEFGSLVAALAELPEAQRRALVGRELGGYTHEQIAREMKITSGATKQLIFRARTGLRDALGALIPAPLIVWLASDAGGAFTAASSTGVAAGGAAVAGAAGGAAGGSAGIFAGLAGGGAAKFAAIAVAATGTVAAGVAVEQRVVGGADGPAVARQAEGSAAAQPFDGSSGTPVEGAPAGFPGPGRDPGDAGKPKDSAGSVSAGGAPADGLAEEATVETEAGSEEESSGSGFRPGRGDGSRPWRPAGGGGGGKWGGGTNSGGGGGSGQRPNRPWKPSGGGGKWGGGANSGGGGGSGQRPIRPWKPSGGGGGAGAGATNPKPSKPWRPSGGRTTGSGRDFPG